MIQFFKKYHKWIGIIITLFMLLFAFSGIVLNHRTFFSACDVSREYLPQNYSFDNWNLASVKGIEPLTGDSLLIYGNAGIWLSDSAFSAFSDFSKGLPKGIDAKKTSQIYKTRKGQLFAGTLFGLYRYENAKQAWKHIPLPLHNNPAIVDITEKGDTLLILNRSFLFSSTDGQNFTKHQLAKAKGMDNKVSLFKTLWVIHSGEIFGTAGKLIVDAIALIFIFLTLTGLILFITPRLIRRKKRQHKGYEGLKKNMRWNLKWHNKIGWISLVFLIITSLTGMFLRPPFLIAIASARVDKIPLTTLDNENVWFDKLRVIDYNDSTQTYIVGTNQGMYHSKNIFTEPLQAFPQKVPVSIMGITVFQQKSTYEYLVGSFQGLFLWNTQTGAILDYITRKKYLAPPKKRSPVGRFLVSGYIKNYQGKECFFDYRQGLSDINGTPLSLTMPEQIRKQAMSLWNVMLEVHTGRIFQSILGMFYILIVPLLGLLTLFVLISGFVVWYERHRRKRK